MILPGFRSDERPEFSITLSVAVVVSSPSAKLCNWVCGRWSKRFANVANASGFGSNASSRRTLAKFIKAEIDCSPRQPGKVFNSRRDQSLAHRARKTCAQRATSIKTDGPESRLPLDHM